MDDARTFTAKERKGAAKSGAAMSDGSFPIKSEKDLKNAIGLVGNAANPAAAKAHVMKRAKKLGMTAKLPKGWTAEKAYADIASMSIECPDDGRRFFADDSFIEHAETVHTFSDLQNMVGEELNDQFGQQSNYNVVPPIQGIWVYIQDMTDAWVVWKICGGDEDGDLYQADYTIDDTNNTVSFSTPVEVVRRTVYDVVNDPEDAPGAEDND